MERNDFGVWDWTISRLELNRNSKLDIVWEDSTPEGLQKAGVLVQQDETKVGCALVLVPEKHHGSSSLRSIPNAVTGKGLVNQLVYMLV